MADESTYEAATGSALIAAQPLQNGGGCLQSLGQDKWLRQVVEVFRSGFDLLPPARIISRGEPCGTGVRSATGRPRSVISTISPAFFDQSEKLARPLPQFADPDRSHVLHIAH